MRIVRYPHPALRHRATAVTHIDKQLRLQAGRMFELMYEADGVGLAATQVALPYQLVVLNEQADPNQTDAERVYVNPAIAKRKGLVDDEEGCLSFPGMYAKVKRSKQVVIEAYDLAGQKATLQVDGMLARIWQHEIDHLNGMLFIDRFSVVTRLSQQVDLKALESRFKRAQDVGEIPTNAEIEKLLHALEAEMSSAS
jgi:peptide deformylase